MNDLKKKEPREKAYIAMEKIAVTLPEESGVVSEYIKLLEVLNEAMEEANKVANEEIDFFDKRLNFMFEKYKELMFEDFIS